MVLNGVHRTAYYCLGYNNVKSWYKQITSLYFETLHIKIDATSVVY